LTTTDDTTKLAKNLTKHFFVERYSIAIGDLTDTKSIETMKNLSSDIKNGQHFFKISNEESKFKQVMSSMINKGKIRHVIFHYFLHTFFNKPT
jgi:hypothetical protein